MSAKSAELLIAVLSSTALILTPVAAQAGGQLPAISAPLIAAMPTPPQPITATVSPGATFEQAVDNSPNDKNNRYILGVLHRTDGNFAAAAEDATGDADLFASNRSDKTRAGAEDVAAAACFLPLTVNQKLSKTLGSRHRAAVGVTEESDAVALVVSEETGGISIVVEGVIERELTAQALRARLRALLLQGRRRGTA